MAKLTFGKKIGYQSPHSVEPIEIMNGTDTLVLKIEDDLSEIVVSSTTAAGSETIYIAELIQEGNAKTFRGDAANAAAVYAEVGTIDAAGSLYLSTAGGIFFQVADAGEAADWETVTTS